MLSGRERPRGMVAQAFAYAFLMRVRVLYFAVLKDVFGREREELELSDGATVKGLLEGLAERGTGVAGRLWDSIAVAVNQEYAQGDVVLRDGDEVALLPPVSGGCGA
jgi:molybdopterin converting factor subunit 1